MSGSKKPDAMFDPFRQWRDFLDQSEQRLNDQLNKLMVTPEYNQATQHYMQAFLGMQKAMHEGTQKYLEAMNLPSRDDIAALGTRLSVIEKRLASMERKMGGVAAAAPAEEKPQAPASRPRRTRKPASAAGKDGEK